jgi:hypothetical protein
VVLEKFAARGRGKMLLFVLAFTVHIIEAADSVVILALAVHVVQSALFVVILAQAVHVVQATGFIVFLGHSIHVGESKIFFLAHTACSFSSGENSGFTFFRFPVLSFYWKTSKISN